MFYTSARADATHLLCTHKIFSSKALPEASRSASEIGLNLNPMIVKIRLSTTSTHYLCISQNPLVVFPWPPPTTEAVIQI